MPSSRATDHARKNSPHGSGDAVVWNVDQLNRLLAVARALDGLVDQIPARLWWNAFLLVLLDTALTFRDLLACDGRVYDRTSGQLAVGLIVYQLDPRAAAAVNALLDEAASRPQRRLFPCPWNRPTLAYRFADLVSAAGVQRPARLEHLRQTARRMPELVSTLDLSLVRRVRVPVRTPLVQPRARRQLPVVDAPPGTLLRFAVDYPDLKLELKFETAYLYVIVARMFTDWCLEQRRQGLLPDDGHPPVWLRTLNVELVLRWLKSLDSAPTTVNSHRGTILTLWRRAAATRDKTTGKRLAPRAPTILDLPKRRIPKNNPVSWTPEELQRLLEACEQLTGYLQHWPSIKRSEYWFSLVLFLYESGARIGAAAAVRPADVDLDYALVSLRSADAKTLLEQPIRISSHCVKAIQAILDPERPTVWPTGAYRHDLYKTLKSLLKQAKLPTDRKSKFHRIRRTTATQAALHGSMELAQRQLGHTSVSMTLKYIDARIIRPAQAIDVLPSVVSSKGAP
jgi:integrase